MLARGSRRFLFSIALLIAAMPGAGAQTQATTGVLRGVVTDTAGAPLRGVSVTIRHVETNDVQVYLSNSAGVYVAPLLRVGDYGVQVRAVGFVPAARQGVSVALGASAVADFALRPIVTTLAPVAVAGTATPIEQTRSGIATRLDTIVTRGLPNNGRNYLDLVLLTPHAAIVSGPDGDELSIGGQRGIHNNVSVDGADFNNPFFGEHRGGQRPPFTFNLDAIEQMVVTAQGASAEFGRSSGGFVNVLTRSGTNQLHGSLHYFGKADQLSAAYRHELPGDSVVGFAPDYSQHQFGFTLGGPIRRDRAFFFVAYDQQLQRGVKQKNRLALIPPALQSWVDTAFGGALRGDFGPISRTSDAAAFLAKVDVRATDRHQISLKYSVTDSRQRNGTFDVDAWGRSVNGVEKDHSQAFNGSVISRLSNMLTNELRFQVARETRPRPYEGPDNPRTGRPFPDTDISFAGFRVGMPFFLPASENDTRFQLLDNVSRVIGTHLIKGGVEYNHTRSKQRFVGLANGRMAFTSVDGFLAYVRSGNGYVECSNATTSTTGACPAGTTITGPVLLYLQQVGVSPLTVDQAGTQDIPQREIGLFLQDAWRPTDRLSVDAGLRWERQIHPDPVTPPDQVFFAPFIGTTVSNGRGTFAFPSDGRIPSEGGLLQPRVGIAWDARGDGSQLFRANAGVYHARIPALTLALALNTNGSVGQTLFRNSEASPFLGRPPQYGELLPPPTGGPFQPGVYVFDRDFKNPRTVSLSTGYERRIATGVSASLSYLYARGDRMTRIVDRNDSTFGRPWATGLPAGNGLGSLTVFESTARSRYHGVTVGLHGSAGRAVAFDANYTLSYDRSDDDNERDDFTFRYARPNNLAPEFGWSDRDQRHRFNAFLLTRLPGSLAVNNRVRLASAQPVSERCGAGNVGTGERAVLPGDRVCPDATILDRNTLRRDNPYFSWDTRISRPFHAGGNMIEVVAEVFNLTNADNFKDPPAGGLFLNFDGTVRSGLSEPRQGQLGLRFIF